MKTASDKTKTIRRKGPHICSVKGKYNGAGGQGKRYAGAKAGFGCECKMGFLPSSGGSRIKYAFKTDKRRPGASIITYTDDNIPKGYKAALPCQESFLDNTSVTLKNYIKAHPESSTFKKGCQGLEDELRAEKLVNHNAYDGDRAPELMPYTMGSNKRPTVFAVDNFIGFNNFFKANLEADKLEKINEGIIDESSPFHYSSVLGKFMAPSPSDLRQGLLRELIEDKTFLEYPEDGEALHATAILIDLGFNKNESKHFIKEIFPDYDEERFKTLEATVNVQIDFKYFDKNKKKNNLYENYEKAWNSLTKKQQNILKRTLLSEEKETAKEIAKSLRIAESSVIDRKKKALAKFIKAFPKQLVPLSKQKKTYTKTELNRKETQFNGLFRLSNYEKLRPCKITNHKTGKVETVTQERVKLKSENAELKSKVWEWINETRPEIYQSDFN